MTELIAEFITRDEEFARLWAERDVKVNGRGHKVMRHPDAEDDLIDARTRLQEHTNKTK